MQIIEQPINIKELTDIANQRFGDMTKAVVDVKRQIMVVDADLHADQESFLLERGSKQEDLWGINLYPEFFEQADFIEFDSMINLRPSWGNNSRSVEDPEMQLTIKNIVAKLITQ